MLPATASNLQQRDQNRYQFLTIETPSSALVGTVSWAVLISAF